MKMRNSILPFSLMFSGTLLAFNPETTPLSLAYNQADFVILAKAQSLGLAMDFEYTTFYKGTPQSCPKLTYLDSTFRKQPIDYFVQKNHYLLFVKNKLLFQVFPLGLDADLPSVNLFFSDLKGILSQRGVVNRMSSYRNRLAAYFKDVDMSKFALQELTFPGRYYWLGAGATEKLLGRKMQYQVLELLKTKGAISKADKNVFIHLDSIDTKDFQSYYYHSFGRFYKENLKENQNSGFPKIGSAWSHFLDLFYEKATHDDLFHLLHAYLNTSTVLHFKKSYLKNPDNILQHLRNYIQQNKPMFSLSFA